MIGRKSEGFLHGFILALQCKRLILVHTTVRNKIAKPSIIAGETQRLEEEIIERLARGPVELSTGWRQVTCSSGKLDGGDDFSGSVLAPAPENLGL
jgi:hypothetical protein